MNYATLILLTNLTMFEMIVSLRLTPDVLLMSVTVMYKDEVTLFLIEVQHLLSVVFCNAGKCIKAVSGEI